MLIYLADLAHTYTTKNESLMVPLNIGYLKAYAMEQHKGEINIKLFKDPSKLLACLDSENPDLVGLANYGWNADLNTKIGKYIKFNSPKTIIISGGPNIDEEDESRINFLNENSYIDYYITDGGEEPFSEIISWLKNNKKFEIPKNIIYLKKNGKLFNSGRRPLKKESNHINSPYLLGYLDEFLDLNMIPLIETNRGCPFRCSFCAWGMASHDIVSKLNIDNTLAEIEYIGKRAKVNNWIICDANFGMLKRDVEIAKAIRKAHDKYKYPKTCQMWLSKNTSDRNLEIAKILGDMIVPTMAIQSMDEEVLSNINRDNISSETYYKYQKRFHSMGSTTYSDLIIPLPMEKFSTHLDGLRKLFDVGVDIIQNHNMRMLPGCEMNTPTTRKKFNFKTKYRLIHGDSGIYKTRNGENIKSFELEESLRSTNTMSEKDLFKLREIHFFIEFAWNLKIYSDLLQIAKNFKINQLDLILNFISNTKKNKKLSSFWRAFNKASKGEWFSNRKDAEKFFSKKKNFNRLVNQEYEKINIQYAIIILRDYKKIFDEVFLNTIKSYEEIPKNFVENLSTIVFAQFPPLESGDIKIKSMVDFKDIFNNEKKYESSSNIFEYTFPKNKLQEQVTNILLKKGTSISKVLNTQAFSIRDLKRSFVIDKNINRNQLN